MLGNETRGGGGGSCVCWLVNDDSVPSAQQPSLSRNLGMPSAQKGAEKTVKTAVLCVKVINKRMFCVKLITYFVTQNHPSLSASNRRFPGGKRFLQVSPHSNRLSGGAASFLQTLIPDRDIETPSKPS